VKAIERALRSGESLLRAVAPPSGRKRLRETPAEPALVLVDALNDLADALSGQGEDLDALSRRALGVTGSGRGLPRAELARARRLGGARRARVGAGRRLLRAAGAALGGRADGRARLGDPHDG